MRRTKSSRNFWGGFYGGTLGLILTGYLSAFLLPVGCLVGFLLGYYYYEVYRLARYTWRRNLPTVWAKSALDGICRKFEGAVSIVACRLSQTKQIATKIVRFPVFLPIMVVVGSARGIASGWRWVNAHPVHEARALRVLAAAVSLFIGGTAIYYSLGTFAHFAETLSRDAFPSLWEISTAGMGIGFLTSALIGNGWLVFVGFFGKEDWSPNENRKVVLQKRIRNWYLEYQAFKRWGGTVGWFLRCLGLGLGFMVFGVVVGSVFLPLVFMIGILAVIVCVPLGLSGLLLYGVLRGLYKVSRRQEHWVGVATTVAITVVTAAVAWPVLSGMMLWFIALANGAFCGRASVSAVFAVHRFFEKNEELVVALYHEDAPFGPWLKALCRAVRGKTRPVFAR